MITIEDKIESFKRILNEEIDEKYDEELKKIASETEKLITEYKAKKYEEIGRIYYEDFIQKLPKNKYEFIDATYILIEPLNKKEIYKILDYYELNKSK